MKNKQLSLIDLYRRLRMTKLGFKIYLSLRYDIEYWEHRSDILSNEMNKLTIYTNKSGVVNVVLGKSTNIDDYLSKFDKSVIFKECVDHKTRKMQLIDIKVSINNPEDFI